MMFLETSAMEGHNIDKAFAVMISGTFTTIAEIVKRQKLSDNKPKSPTKKETLQMTKIKNENGKKKDKCCNWLSPKHLYSQLKWLSSSYEVEPAYRKRWDDGS